MARSSSSTASRRPHNSTSRRGFRASGDVMRSLLAVLVSASIAVAVVHTQDAAPGKLDYAMFSRIRDEGLNRSQVLDHVSWLADVYGPRLQGSPAMRQAAEWVEKRLGSWGLSGVHEEKWPFGKGWALVRFSAH